MARSPRRANKASAGMTSVNEGPRPTESALSQYSGNLEAGAGEDEPVDENSDLTVIQCVRECFREARDASRIRRKQSQVNWYAYMGQQDWSGKVKGQSREYIPKTPLAVDQLSFFIKKALTAFGDWFQVDLARHVNPNIPMTGEQIRDLMTVYLDMLPDGMNKTTTFDIRMADAMKVGLLQSLMIFKIYGRSIQQRRYSLEEGERYETPITQMPGTTPMRLSVKEVKRWYLCVDLVRPDDYYPDPSGNGLYEIHKCEKDLHEVIEMAENGIYDKDAVDLLKQSFERPAQERRKDTDMGQERTPPPSFRKKVVILEYWGTLLNAEGHVGQRNIVCAIADDQYLVRPPEPNPFWHGESPFVVCPIIRVPFSVWHKALFDHASSLNFAINELFNLILDGGISAVWGIKQIRADMLENPDEITAGIAQGATLAVKNELPAGEKVLEIVSQGQVPQDAMAVYEATNREFEAAALTNELKLGQMPARKPLATEIEAIGQGQSNTLEGIAGIIEQECIEKVLRKSWLCILQDADSLLSEDMVNAIGAPAALTLRRMSEEQRFAAFAGTTDIKVTGLTAIIAKAQAFQKQAALMQIVMNNPLLAQAYQQKFSAERQLEFLMKALNINPEDVEKTQEEIQQNAAELQRTMAMAGAMNPARGGNTPTGNASNTGTSAPQAGEINQLTTPATGMVGNG